MDFYLLVEEMRNTQKAYYKEKPYTFNKKELLDRSKKLELQVDKAIVEHHQIKAAEYLAAQQDLFTVGNE